MNLQDAHYRVTRHGDVFIVLDPKSVVNPTLANASKIGIMTGADRYAQA